MSIVPPGQFRVSTHLRGSIERDFWLAHVRIGFGIFLAESLAALAYVGFTPHGPHRHILWLVVMAWAAISSVNLLLAPRLAPKHWCARYSAAWTVLSIFAVGGVAYLDGGVESPFIFLLFLPISFAAFAFTPRIVCVCGLATLASATVVATTDSDVRLSLQSALLLLAVLVGASALSVAASVNRCRRERHEELLADQLAALAATDGLTGCAVHRAFHQRCEEEVARSVRHGHPLSLMMIDVDYFKSVNDTYGHVFGDQVLAGIGAALRANARSSDLVGRVGGDEFAILMPDTEVSSAITLAERVRRQSSVISGVPVTLSIGVSGLDPLCGTTKQMLSDADSALYEVKQAGRNNVMIHRVPFVTSERQ
jgi:diguanylate cyclase (GGDEF)-like protein